MEKELSDLSKLTTTILRVHGSEHKELYRVHKLFHAIKVNLIQQTIKEKVDVNPKVRIYNRKPSEKLLEKISEGRKELALIREENIELLKELREVTNGYSAPDDGCPTYDTTYEKLKELESKILDN